MPRRKKQTEQTKKPKIIQTVSVGEGDGIYLTGRKTKFPEREYMAVDPTYAGKRRKANAAALRKLGVIVESTKIIPAMEKMIAQEVRVKHFNIDMPNPRGGIKKYGFNRFFNLAKEILFPNGKVYIRSNDTSYLMQIAAEARKAGFAIRPLKKDSGTNRTRWTADANAHLNQKVFILECTFRLKTAMPNKKDRKNIN